MPMRQAVPIHRLSDGYIKVGDGPYTKWAITTVGGEKIYTLSVKESSGDTPKDVISA